MSTDESEGTNPVAAAIRGRIANGWPKHRDYLEGYVPQEDSTPVPVSGEDQPDPRVKVLDQLWMSGEHCPGGHGWPEPVSVYDCSRCTLAAIDSADRAAGIRRVTGQFAGPDLARCQDPAGAGVCDWCKHLPACPNGGARVHSGGNGEDCSICRHADLPYPWLCVGGGA